MGPEDLHTEIELITSSLLPAERLEQSSSASDPESSAGSWMRTIDITSEDSRLALHVVLREGYPAKQSVRVGVKDVSAGRDEAERWKRVSEEGMNMWDESDDYPLYTLLTTLFIPLLAPSSSPSPSSPPPNQTAQKSSIDIANGPAAPAPHHALLTSHHLIAPSKRKDLFSLSSSLSLVGFAKVGHPGIIYAVGEKEDLEEWLREVKSWQWLALRVRITPEPLPLPLPHRGGGEGEKEGTRGAASGARGGKGRGEWTEVEKITEALDWLKASGGGREKMLLDLGMGGTGKGA